MAILTKDAILAAQDLPRELVSVPEWGGEIYVRTLTGAERDALEAEGADAGKKIADRMRNFRARVVGRSVVDEKGERLFSDADIETLGKRSARALDRLFEVASRLSGIMEADVKALEKN